MCNFETLRQFQNLGCQNPTKAALACRVYQNLETIKKYTNIDKVYSIDHGFIYLSALNEETHIFIPLLSSQQCDLVELDEIQTNLQETHKESIIHLAICDSASNVLYYTITKGFKDKVDNVPRKR